MTVSRNEVSCVDLRGTDLDIFHAPQSSEPGKDSLRINLASHLWIRPGDDELRVVVVIAHLGVAQQCRIVLKSQPNMRQPVPVPGFKPPLKALGDALQDLTPLL